MSCPVSTPGRSGRLVAGVGEDSLECPVLAGVVAEVVVPAAPDDVCPGSAEDAYCVGVVVAAGDGSVVEVGGPGVVVAGVAGEVAQGVSELFVASPAERDGFDLAGLPGRWCDTGQGGQGVGGGELAAGVADLGEQPGGAQGLDPRQGRVDVGVGVGLELGGEVVLEDSDLGVQDPQERHVGLGGGGVDGRVGAGGSAWCCEEPGVQHGGVGASGVGCLLYTSP